VPEPAEGADDLVGDEQYAVPVADLADPGEVAWRWREAAPAVLHRLQEDRRHRLRALELDHLGDGVRGPPAERLVVVAVLRRPVEVGVGHLVRPRHQRLEVDLRRRDTGDRQRPHRGAVVGDVAADHLVAARLPDRLEVLAGDLPRRLDGLAAAGGEEDPVQVTGRELGQPFGQRDRLRVGVGPQREERELAGLLVRRLGELLPAVPDLYDEESRQPVEVALAAGVPDVGTLAAHDHRHVCARVRRHPGEVHPQVVTCARGQGTGSGVVARREARRRFRRRLRCGGHRVPHV
jgi:hypothetical protein